MAHQEITLTSVAESIEDLAVMIKDGFDDIGKQLRVHDGRLDKIDGRLDKMDERFDGIDVRLDKMDERLDKMDGRLDRIELLAFGDYRRRIERLEDEVFRQKSIAA